LRWLLRTARRLSAAAFGGQKTQRIGDIAMWRRARSVGVPLILVVTAAGLVSAGKLPVYSQAGDALGGSLAFSGALYAAATEVAARGFDRAPAVALSIASLLVVPALALIGAVVCRLGRVCSLSDVVHRPAAESGAESAVQGVSKAWISIAGDQTRNFDLRGEITHIGRDSDNRLAVADSEVEGLHAIIRRTLELEFVIVDVSGREGGGMLVNGKQRPSAELVNGDRIALGDQAITFHRVMRSVPRRDAAASSLTQ
jgi:hypothetical protein